MFTKRNLVGLAVTVGLATLVSQNVAAQGMCDEDFPEGQKFERDEETGRFKLKSVAIVDVLSSAPSAVNFARKRAYADAQNGLIYYLNTHIKTDAGKNEAAKQLNAVTSGANGDGEAGELQTSVDMVEAFAKSSEGLLRGALQLGSCFDKENRQLYAAYGIKSETLEAATSLAGDLAEPIQRRSAGSSENKDNWAENAGDSSETGSTGKPRETGSYNNSRNIRDF